MSSNIFLVRFLPSEKLARLLFRSRIPIIKYGHGIFRSNGEWLYGSTVPQHLFGGGADSRSENVMNFGGGLKVGRVFWKDFFLVKKNWKNLLIFFFFFWIPNNLTLIWNLDIFFTIIMHFCRCISRLPIYRTSRAHFWREQQRDDYSSGREEQQNALEVPSWLPTW